MSLVSGLIFVRHLQPGMVLASNSLEGHRRDFIRTSDNKRTGKGGFLWPQILPGKQFPQLGSKGLGVDEEATCRRDTRVTLILGF